MRTTSPAGSAVAAVAPSLGNQVAVAMAPLDEGAAPAWAAAPAFWGGGIWRGSGRRRRRGKGWAGPSPRGARRAARRGRHRRRRRRRHSGFGRWIAGPVRRRRCSASQWWSCSSCFIVDDAGSARRGGDPTAPPPPPPRSTNLPRERQWGKRGRTTAVDASRRVTRAQLGPSHTYRLREPRRTPARARRREPFQRLIDGGRLYLLSVSVRPYV